MQKIPRDVYLFLFAPKDLTRKIKTKENRANALRYCLGPSGIDYSKDAVQTSPSDKMSEIMAEVADLDEEIKTLTEQLADAIIEVDDAINSLEDSTESLVLSCYYINGDKMKDIAKLINHSVPNCYHVKSRALRKLAEAMQVDKKNKMDVLN